MKTNVSYTRLLCFSAVSLFLLGFIASGTAVAADASTPPKEDGSAKKLKVLFLCTGNSCRSQMAEGWAHALQNDLIEAYSAGVDPHGMNPNAVRVMKESGVDISSHKSEHVNDYLNVPLDYVIAVCGNADDKRPDFGRSVKVIFHPFDDPPKLAKTLEKEEDQLNCYRRVRDEIKDYVLAMTPASLEKEAKSGTTDVTVRKSFVRRSVERRPILGRFLPQTRFAR